MNATGLPQNYTVVSLSFFRKVAPYSSTCTPLPTCTVGAQAAPVERPGRHRPPFGYVTSGGWVGVLLLATPVALLVAGGRCTSLVVLRRSASASPSGDLRAVPGR